MGINETLKSYLVSLGYEVDSSTYTKFVSTLKQAQSQVEQHSNILSGSFAKAGLAYAGMVGTIVATTATMLNSLAKADMEYEKTALSLHMAKDAAKQYSIALKVLGQPPEMLAWMPELHERYVQLRKDAMQMELPGEYSKRMQMVRGIGQEFNRLKQESMYALEWIGFSIVKHLQDPLEKTKWTFASFNQKIIETMPIWTEKIGSKIANILGIFGDAGKVLGVFGEKMKVMWDSFAPTTKGLIGIVVLTFLFSKMGPFGKIMVLLSLATLAASEFWAAMQGKNTLIPQEALWELATAFNALYISMANAYHMGKAFWASASGIGSMVKYALIVRNRNKAEEEAETAKSQFLSYNEYFGGNKKAKLPNIEASAKERGKYLEGLSDADYSRKYGSDALLAQRKEIVRDRYTEASKNAELYEKERQESEEAIRNKKAIVDKALSSVKDYSDVNIRPKNPFLDPDKWKPEDLAAENKSIEEGKGHTSKWKELMGQASVAVKKDSGYYDLLKAQQVSGALPSNLPKNVEQYRSIIEAASKEYGVPANLIAGIIAKESGGRGRPGPVVNVGRGAEQAQGLMQLLPSSFGGRLITKDYENIMTGTEYFSKLMKEKGSVEGALAAYGGFKTKDPTAYITDIMKYAASYSGASVNSNNTNYITVEVNMPIENAERNIMGKVDIIADHLAASLDKSLKELTLPGYTVNDSSGFMPGPPVNASSMVPSVAGGG